MPGNRVVFLRVNWILVRTRNALLRALKLWNERNTWSTINNNNLLAGVHYKILTVLDTHLASSYVNEMNNCSDAFRSLKLIPKLLVLFWKLFLKAVCALQNLYQRNTIFGYALSNRLRDETQVDFWLLETALQCTCDEGWKWISSLEHLQSFSIHLKLGGYDSLAPQCAETFPVHFDICAWTLGTYD